jgi:ABC-type transporter Mla subunit MlaD
MSLFSIDVFHHVVTPVPPTLGDQLARILERLNTMSTAQTQLAAALEAKTAQIIKAIGEVTAATTDLEEQIAALDTIDPALQAAFDRLAGTVQALDDLNPDAPAPTPEPTPA